MVGDHGHTGNSEVSKMDATDIAEELQDTIVGEDKALAEAPPPEKMLPASRVNQLVQQAKRDGARKMQEQLDAANQQIQQLQGQQAQQPLQPQQQPPSQPQGQQGMTPEQMQQVMQMVQQKQQEEAEKAHQAQLEREVNAVAEQYFGKLAQGKDLYEDFEAVTADFDPAAFPQLVYLATQADNTPAIIYELAKNPAKLAQLSVLVDKSPQQARKMIASLSESIKTNDIAKKNVQEAQDPLSRLKPSPVGTDNGTKTVRDFKNASFLRG
jgi:hypothetical protein